MCIGDLQHRAPTGKLLGHCPHAGTHLSHTGEITRHGMYLELVAESREHRRRVRLQGQEFTFSTAFLCQLPVALLERSYPSQEKRADALVRILKLGVTCKPHRRDTERNIDRGE